MTLWRSAGGLLGAGLREGGFAPTVRQSRLRRGTRDEGTAISFESALEPRLAEVRMELVREARHLLIEFTRRPSAETRGRLLQALDDLALLVRAEPGELGW